jgi:hypothetical protein
MAVEVTVKGGDKSDDFVIGAGAWLILLLICRSRK